MENLRNIEGHFTHYECFWKYASWRVTETDERNNFSRKALAKADSNLEPQKLLEYYYYYLTFRALQGCLASIG